MNRFSPAKFSECGTFREDRRVVSQRPNFTKVASERIVSHGTTHQRRVIVTHPRRARGARRKRRRLR